ncbi:MAG: hypothetical protein ACREII_03450 [Nitrospiraceae bacterium]
MPAIRNILSFTCLGMCAFFFASCIVSRHPAGIASSTAPVSSSYTVLGSVEETSCSYQILFIPFGGKDPTDEMIQKAVRENGADALAGVTVEHRGSTFALPFFASDCTIVKGQAVKNVQ